jgi:hypothetical protein
MLPHQQVNTVTHAAELLNFIQIALGSMGYAAFLRNLERKLQVD